MKGDGGMAELAFDDPGNENDIVDPAPPSVNKVTISPCPTLKNKHLFVGHTMDHVGGVYNTLITGERPTAIKRLEVPIGEFMEKRMQMGWRNRSASIVDLDDLVGEIMGGLDGLGVLGNT